MEFNDECLPSKIGIVGLGYVGLPLALECARHFSVIGYDHNPERIDALQRGCDHTGEIDTSDLKSSTLAVTSHLHDLAGSNLYIVTVPTPVTADKMPDLGYLRKAAESVGELLRTGDVVVFESTVYPGVSEDFCGPILEKVSGMRSGQDFFIGYSPERANPGDRSHGLSNVTKVVSAQIPAVTRWLTRVYGALNGNNVHATTSIRVAEAAKVIENAQRDVNIAFVNEVSTILARLGISTYEVLEAAATKWNFLPFNPGLVGGHCIGVDPYYLAHAAHSVGAKANLILAARSTNEAMSSFFASELLAAMEARSIASSARILILGLTFKENVPDLRNSKVIDFIHAIKARGAELDLHDPLADPIQIQEMCGIKPLKSLQGCSDYEVLVGAVPHESYKHFNSGVFKQILRKGGLIADLKKLWRSEDIGDTFQYWTL